jgi:hypothetical protein
MSKLSNERLAELYGLGTSRGSARADCPSSEALAAAAMGEQQHGLEAVARHLASCSDCAEEYRIAQSLRPWAAPGASHDVPRARKAAREVGPWLALAASLAAVGVGLSALLNRTPAGDSGSENTRRAAPSSETIELLGPKGPAGAPGWRFQWKPVAAAEAYRVHVFSEDGIPVWTSGATSETSLPPPPEAPFRTGNYLWHVSALRGGEPVARSGVGFFSIAR